MSDAEKLLYTQEVEGVEKLEIGADGERFFLDLVEEDGDGGVRIGLTEKERQAVRDRFDVLERAGNKERKTSADGDTE